MDIMNRARSFGPVVWTAAALLVVGLAGCGKTEQEQKAEAEVVKAQATGGLVVKSNRPGATVEATRVPPAGEAAAAGVRGVVDQPLSGLLPGKYDVTVRSDGWPDARGEIAVPAGRMTEFELNCKSGSLRLDSDPAGATVKLAGAVLGKTPLGIPQLPVGEHQLILEYPSWPAVPAQVTIMENTETAETVRLPHGKLTVASTPPGATVLLEGKAYTQTPLFFDPLPAGVKKLTLQAKDFPPLEVSVTVEDRGDVKINPELGNSYPALDPAALLSAVWVPDDPNKLSPGVDSLGRYEPRNGIVKNLHRKRLYETWLRRTYRYAATVKAYDPKSGKVEFVEQANALARFRVVAELSPAARGDPSLAARTTKDARLILYGQLGAVEEPRWPLKVITLEISSAELLR